MRCEVEGTHILLPQGLSLNKRVGGVGDECGGVPKQCRSKMRLSVSSFTRISSLLIIGVNKPFWYTHTRPKLGTKNKLLGREKEKKISKKKKKKKKKKD